MSTCLRTVTHVVSGMAIAALLVACGGGGGGDGGDKSDDNRRAAPVSTNVALSSAGGTAISTYSGNETFVNDGDTGTTNFWQAGSAGDSITLYLNGVYDAKTITIRSSNLTSNADFKLELSANGVDYTEMNLISDCLNFSLSAAGYTCDFKQAKEVQELRLTILQKADMIEIYEWEVIGSM